MIRKNFKINNWPDSSKISKKYFRPNEVDNLIGNSTKAKKLLTGSQKISINELIREMLEEDIKLSKSLSLKK